MAETERLRMTAAQCNVSIQFGDATGVCECNQNVEVEFSASVAMDRQACVTANILRDQMFTFRLESIYIKIGYWHMQTNITEMRHLALEILFPALETRLEC